MEISKSIQKIEKIDIVIFAIITLVFIFAWTAFAPAILTNDSIGQLEQSFTNSYNNAHPILYSIIIGTLTKVFNNVSAVSIFQIIIFGLLWTICCRVARNGDLSIKAKAFQILITIIISITPINFMYSITLWKDILYTYSILSVILCTYIGIKNEFKYTFFQMIITSISLVLIMKFRHNGMPIGIIMFIILLILNFYSNCKIKKRIKSLYFILIFTIFLLISYIPQFVYCKSENTLTMTSAFTITKVCCMGYLLETQDINLENEEYKIINSVLNIDSYKKLSNPYWGTAIIYSEDLNKSYLEEHINEFSDIFFKYAKRYPKTVIKYFVKSNSTAWSISNQNAWTHTVFTDNKYEEYETKPIFQTLNKVYLKYIENTSNNKVMYALLYRPATYMYASLILELYILIKERKIKYILLVFPMILNVGTYIPFIISQEVRYLYPNFVTFYFIVLVCYNIKNKRKNKEVLQMEREQD